jgi:hypothetical protein
MRPQICANGGVVAGAIVAALKDCMIASRQAWTTKNFPIVVVGTTADPDKTPGAIISLFKHSVTFPVRDPFSHGTTVLTSVWSSLRERMSVGRSSLTLLSRLFLPPTSRSRKSRHRPPP